MDLKYPAEEIESEELSLRRFDVAMTQDLFQLVDSNRVRLGKFLDWVEWTKTPGDEEKYLIASKKFWMNGERFDYGIFHRRDGKMIGTVGGHTISFADNRIEIGYWIGAEHEGKGLMSQAVTLLEKEFFTIGFHRIEIRCEPENTRSAAIPKRLGYDFEGHLKHNKFINGRYRDTLLFAKLNPGTPYFTG